MLDAKTITRLRGSPDRPIEGRVAGAGCIAELAIPHYAKRIGTHYADLLPAGLAAFCEQLGIARPFEHFGLVISFTQPTELTLYGDDLVIGEDLRDAIANFGPVILRNAHVEKRERGKCQHNIFPDLRFHVDRGGSQPNQISMYTRDCSDPSQREPRTSSTVFIANAVGALQDLRERKCAASDDAEFSIRYDIFKQAPLDGLLGEIVLDQPWTAATPVGEIAAIDNRTVLHASFYRNGQTAGYPIGTRYLI